MPQEKIDKYPGNNSSILGVKDRGAKKNRI
jgi:hypothetical protein